ncbi:hypothetical protein FSS13T_24170 [Flavobacterium saliperosum S13]|uniref:DUF4397 domain-containing protein n=2 Tax=Flavobacterium saliperosum TaxID=329186 RepID=A0A1G4W8R3_9FLAO|nr:hypothetical protein [Flavobacterium saliperosum]ESU22966.1 hypothetical protein FSS13T_24170 [Flavobacterium saliperosum S13]SCX17902.1 hypothetical protein SAMN02927925_02608 [Flavobacterium saliperosum]
MRNSYLVSALLLCNFLTAQISAVGIGTTNPQQKLHLDNSVGTLRVESLDKDNNEYNGGNAVPAGTFPLYVDSDGVLSLKLETLYNSDGSDAIDHLNIPTSSITLPITDADGKVEATFKSYTVTVSRPSILEVKYSVSFEVYQFASPLTKTRDAAARRITTFYSLNGGARRYGQTSRCYMNNNINNPAPHLAGEVLAAAGPAYNSTTTYIQIPAGTHTLDFKAEVSTNLPSLATHVKLAIDTDSIFMRLY